jgi:hypothetical protein
VLGIVFLVQVCSGDVIITQVAVHLLRIRAQTVHTAGFWRRLALAKAALPRYRPPLHTAAAGPLFPFPVKVISLRRSTLRRASIEKQLGEQHVPFTFVDAVDGSNATSFPAADVERYFSGERLASFRRAAGDARDKVACDLSHFKLMHEMLGSSLPAQLVLEDDFRPPEALSARAAPPNATSSPFLAALNATLFALPADWDVLYLALYTPLWAARLGPACTWSARAPAPWAWCTRAKRR